MSHGVEFMHKFELLLYEFVNSNLNLITLPKTMQSWGNEESKYIAKCFVALFKSKGGFVKIFLNELLWILYSTCYYYKRT